MSKKATKKQFMQYARYSNDLLQLESDIIEHSEQQAKVVNYCANSAWYGYGTQPMRGFKSRMSVLVGWKATDHRLKSKDAYDVTYSYLYNLLPDCRHDSICL